MEHDSWKDEYKKWRSLKPFQVKLLDEGAKTLSQAWLINSMWSDWHEIKRIKETSLPKIKTQIALDPWFDE